MKVGIMTWWHYHNYGTALQVVALSKKIEQLSNDVSVINYIPSGIVNNFPQHTGFFEYLYKGIVRKIRKRQAVGIEYSSFEREQKFDNFYETNLNFGKKSETFSDLQFLNNEYDAFVCGSDQIWSPLCYDSHYFLDFVHDSHKKIAYAPSMGMEKILNSDIRNSIAELVSGFESLSTREAKASEYLSNLIQRNVKTVLDPTLLFNAQEWEKIVGIQTTKEQSGYVLVYFLGNNDEHWKKTYKLANELGLAIKIIPVFEADLKREGCITEPVGPIEFVNLIKNASYVCTDSFHGTIFAVNFEKNLSVFERFKKSDKRNQNLRVYNILDMLDLNKCLVRYNDKSNIIPTKLDYTEVNDKLNILRADSIAFLAESLEKSAKNTSTKKAVNLENLCCGCGSCAEICPVNAITICMSEDGFYKANIDYDKCTGCQKCVKICPFKTELSKTGIETGNLYSYKDNDSGVLSTSSSGGFAYRLSAMLLDEGWSIVGCTFDSKYQIARHIVVTPEEKDKLHLLQGSKYIQSNFADVVKAIKETKNPIAVFATPCQISGIKQLLKDRTDVLYVDLICHGVPSYLVLKKYYRHIENKMKIDTNKMNILFRYKPSGWHKKHIMLDDDHKKIILSERTDYFYKLFEKCNAYSKTCYECRWRCNCEADIRMGDYWGERFAEDETGVSMVLSMTDKGKAFVEKISTFGGLIAQPIEDYKACQQTKNFPAPVYYNRLMNDLQNENISMEKIIKKYIKPYDESKLKKELKKLCSKIKHYL